MTRCKPRNGCSLSLLIPDKAADRTHLQSRRPQILGNGLSEVSHTFRAHESAYCSEGDFAIFVEGHPCLPDCCVDHLITCSVSRAPDTTTLDSPTNVPIPHSKSPTSPFENHPYAQRQAALLVVKLGFTSEMFQILSRNNNAGPRCRGISQTEAKSSPAS